MAERMVRLSSQTRQRRQVEVQLGAFHQPSPNIVGTRRVDTGQVDELNMCPCVESLDIKKLVGEVAQMKELLKTIVKESLPSTIPSTSFERYSHDGGTPQGGSKENKSFVASLSNIIIGNPKHDHEAKALRTEHGQLRTRVEELKKCCKDLESQLKNQHGSNKLLQEENLEKTQQLTDASAARETLLQNLAAEQVRSRRLESQTQRLKEHMNSSGRDKSEPLDQQIQEMLGELDQAIQRVAGNLDLKRAEYTIDTMDDELSRAQRETFGVTRSFSKPNAQFKTRKFRVRGFLTHILYTEILEKRVFGCGSVFDNGFAELEQAMLNSSIAPMEIATWRAAMVEITDKLHKSQPAIARIDTIGVACDAVKKYIYPAIKTGIDVDADIEALCQIAFKLKIALRKSKAEYCFHMLSDKIIEAEETDHYEIEEYEMENPAQSPLRHRVACTLRPLLTKKDFEFNKTVIIQKASLVCGPERNNIC